jgi:hypothetical protein
MMSTLTSAISASRPLSIYILLTFHLHLLLLPLCSLYPYSSDDKGESKASRPITGELSEGYLNNKKDVDLCISSRSFVIGSYSCPTQIGETLAPSSSLIMTNDGDSDEYTNLCLSAPYCFLFIYSSPSPSISFSTILTVFCFCQAIACMNF